MSNANLLDTRTISFLELIGNGKAYRVPTFQRDYSWGEEQWEDLWNDLTDLLDDAKARHYLGALVLEPSSDREFLVIDGQQRLATLSLLVLAVISRLDTIVEAGIDPEANRQRAAALRADFIVRKDPASLVESSRLVLNETDDALYQDYLVQLRTPFNLRGLSKSNRLLWECFQYFLRQISALGRLGTDGGAITRLVSETAARQFLFVEMRVDAELSVYTIFETLNARGLDLTATDLLKNYLFSRVRLSSDQEHLRRRWRALMGIVRPEQFPTFLRYHLLCQMPKVRSERLFKLVRDHVRSPDEVFTLIGALETRAELFSALSDPNHSLWIDLPDAKKYIRTLQLIGVRQMTPLLFAAWEALSPSNFASVLRMVMVVSFRYTAVGGLNTNSLEPAYHYAAKAVIDGIAKAPTEVMDQLRAIYVEDDKFMRDFADLEIDTTRQRKKLAKYILGVLEADLSGRAFDPETDPGSIEHILPENPDEAWAEAIPKQKWDSTIYRLGNLLLLEGSANRSAGNADFTEKLASYTQSAYATTRAVAESSTGSWTIAHVDERQRRQANRAVHLWRVDF